MKKDLNIKFFFDSRKGVCIVQLIGYIDESTNPRFSKLLFERIRAGNTKIIIDFSEVSFLLSHSSIGTLMEVYGELDRRGGLLKLCNVPDKLKQTMEMVGYNNFFEIYNSRVECLNSFK